MRMLVVAVLLFFSRFSFAGTEMKTCEIVDAYTYSDSDKIFNQKFSFKVPCSWITELGELTLLGLEARANTQFSCRNTPLALRALSDEEHREYTYCGTADIFEVPRISTKYLFRIGATARVGEKAKDGGCLSENYIFWEGKRTNPSGYSPSKSYSIFINRDVVCEL